VHDRSGLWRFRSIARRVAWSAATAGSPERAALATVWARDLQRARAIDDVEPTLALRTGDGLLWSDGRTRTGHGCWRRRAGCRCGGDRCTGLPSGECPLLAAMRALDRRGSVAADDREGLFALRTGDLRWLAASRRRRRGRWHHRTRGGSARRRAWGSWRWNSRRVTDAGARRAGSRSRRAGAGLRGGRCR